MSGTGTIVIALGGNALSPPGERATVADQFRHTRRSLEAVVPLAEEGWRIAVVHGNGPQVGDELERNELAQDRVAPLPLGVLVAATAGWIGYMVQQSLKNALIRAGIDREVLTVITQTQVDRDDPRLVKPSKPIGHALSDEGVAALRARGEAVGKDGAGRWRRLAPSPLPQDVVEAAAVARLVAGGWIVIASGGGGPPVYRDPEKHWEGVEAVVDKDLAAATLAERVGASVLLILTDVDAVYRDWGTERRRPVRRMTAREARAMLTGGTLGSGSMGPKVEASVRFVERGGERAVIAHLEEGLAALRGGTGTTITGDDR